METVTAKAGILSDPHEKPDKSPNTKMPRKPPIRRPNQGLKKLTQRESKLLKARLEGKSKTEAAIEAGYSPKNAGQSAHQALKNIEEKAPDLFARHGLDPDSFIEKHLIPRLNATQVKAQMFEGGFVYSKPMEDNAVRMQATRLTAELLGLVVKERDTPATSIRVVVINAEDRPKIRGTPMIEGDSTQPSTTTGD